MFYAYVLFSPTTNKIYIGYTSRNPEERLFAHNNIEKGSYTSKFRPWILLFWEVFDSKSEALSREKQLKSAAGRRQEVYPAFPKQILLYGKIDY